MTTIKSFDSHIPQPVDICCEFFGPLNLEEEVFLPVYDRESAVDLLHEMGHYGFSWVVSVIASNLSPNSVSIYLSR